MLNSYKDYNRIIICFVIFCFLGGLLGVQFGLLIKDNIAYADYTEDVLNNPTALVNFNQIASSNFYNTNLNIDYTAILSTTKSIVYHKYYIKIIGSGLLDNGLYLFNDDYTEAQPIIYPFTNDTKNDTLYNCLHTGLNFCYYYRNSAVLNNVMIIDLTQMFGVGNEPNLQQSKDLFVAEYYPYSPGTSISLSGFENYNLGFNDAYANQNIVFKGTILAQNLFAVNEISTSPYNTINSTDLGRGFYIFGQPIVGFNFNAIISSESVYNVNIGRMTYRSSTYSKNIEIGTYNNGVFEVIATIDVDNMTPTLSGTVTQYDNLSTSFTIYNDVSSLYFRFPNAPNGDTTLLNLEIEVESFNVQLAINSSYNNGYANAEEYYKRLYARGGTQWLAIYNEGYYAYPNDDHYDFRSLITAAVDVPVQAMTNLFDFDILGVNMKTFYLSIFTLCVIFMILKLVL